MKPCLQKHRDERSDFWFDGLEMSCRTDFDTITQKACVAAPLGPQEFTRITAQFVHAV
jgi:hypothetical protein